MNQVDAINPDSTCLMPNPRQPEKDNHSCCQRNLSFRSSPSCRCCRSDIFTWHGCDAQYLHVLGHVGIAATDANAMLRPPMSPDSLEGGNDIQYQARDLPQGQGRPAPLRCDCVSGAEILTSFTDGLYLSAGRTAGHDAGVFDYGRADWLLHGPDRRA